jgi:hypothetical protein
MLNGQLLFLLDKQVVLAVQLLQQLLLHIQL